MKFKSWREFIDFQSEQEYFKKIVSFVQEDSKSYTIYPDYTNLFNAFKYCKLENTKVVILGQDPYHGPNQAHGLSFSVLPTEKIPPSLLNIYKEIKSDLKIENGFTNGYLMPWAEQGVLLLNSILTVRAGSPSSHRNRGWETFTNEVLTFLNSLEQPIAYMLWGIYAKNLKSFLTNKNHLILEGSHPSPLSAHTGFFGNNYFSKTNNYLIKNNIKPIDWRIK